MPNWKIYTPDGIQDILFEECYLKRDIEGKVRNVFENSGFMELETPSVEFYDVFDGDSEAIPQERMFKFFDQQGRILVLRPDNTIPVARVAATKLKNYKVPIRCSYIANTFSYNQMGGGKKREYTEAGVELFGSTNPEADAEVIITAIQAIKACGIEEFKIDIGQVEFFKGIMDESGLSKEEREDVRNLIDKKDFIGVEDIVERHNIKEELKEIILNLPSLFGSVDIIEKLEKMQINERAFNALENLRAVLKILDECGLSGYVSIDLGLVQSLNYYTGIIFKGFTYGVGFPILSGGRYDKTVNNFGLDLSATGFSLGINMVMNAINQQKIETTKYSVDAFVCQYNNRALAYELCTKLRDRDIKVEMDIENLSEDDAKKYADNRNISKILIVNEDSIQVVNVNSDDCKKYKIEDIQELVETI